jgi:hypothetical protein
MRAIHLLSAIVITTVLNAANIPGTQPGGLVVHEWGTFTSVAGEDGSAIVWDTLGCKSDLPRFVNDFGYRGLKLGISGTVRMETPVLYFYSSRELGAHVQVTFPQGVITEWYPQAQYEAHQIGPADGSVHLAPRNVAGCIKCHQDLNGIRLNTEKLTGTLEWSNIHVQPGALHSLPVDSEPSRYYAARQTDAAPVTIGDQHEKFLFYRGVGNFPVPLLPHIAPEGQVLVDTRTEQPVPTVILFENHDGRMGYRAASSVQGSLTLDPPSRDASYPRLRNVMEAALVQRGLFPKEAHAMLETWQDSWFEEGSRLIYILPASAVNAILPLEVEPVPAHIERVFVGRIELVTPETKRSLESAIAQSDWATVDRYHRFLDPILRRIYGHPSRVRGIELSYQNHEASVEGGNCR